MDDQLLAAIESRDVQRVLELLAAGANPNAKKGDKTAYELARYGPDEIRCSLIEAGADDLSMRYSLVQIVRTGRVETVKILLAKGADINIGSPLELAARLGHEEIVDLLIAAGADVDNGGMSSTPLPISIENGYFDIALKLIAAGANPNQTNKYGIVPAIAMAAAQGSPEVIKALITAGADVNVMVRSMTINRTKIYKQAGSALKAVFNTLETVGKAFEKLDTLETADQPISELEETIESVDIATSRAKLATSNIAEPEIAFDTFPAILAARCGHGETLAVLLEAGADPYSKDDEGLSAYDRAVKNENAQVLEVLRRFGVDAPRVNPGEYLLNAAEQGDIAAVREAIAQGANIDTSDQRRKTKNCTPLMLAIANGHIEVVDLLLNAGADIDTKEIIDANQRQINSIGIISDDYDWLQSMGFFLGITPLMLAASRGHKDIAQLLIKRQANIQARDCFARDALCLACMNGHLEVAKVLIETGVNINQQDCEGNTPLFMTLNNAHTELAKFLIESGADINAKNHEHQTPLMAAVQKGNLNLVQILIERGADLHAVSKDGDTAMTLADLFDRHQIVELLVEHGVEKRRWNEKDQDDDEDDEAQNDDKRWGTELAKPDFSQNAQNPEYQKLVANLGQICGSHPVPMSDIPGWFRVHVNSKRRSQIKTEDIQREFLERGCFVYQPDDYFEAEGPKELCILPTTDKYDVIALHQTNGCNYGIGPGYVVEWLRELEATQPFILTTIAHDTLEGRFLTPIQDPEGLSERMYDFCSDIVDQGCGSIERLTESLRSSDHLYFWWD